ncbi:branched-subunit amino acid transport system permease [Ochrobactrum sp. BH3]|nr:branched-subunit amino acid transport system permease [Ochrobactrum sp. BH3]
MGPLPNEARTGVAHDRRIPETSHAIGYPVLKIRYMAVLFGGLMAGFAGVYLSVAYTPLWVENMTSGKGWIALALVVFSTWQPVPVLFGA